MKFIILLIGSTFLATFANALDSSPVRLEPGSWLIRTFAEAQGLPVPPKQVTEHVCLSEDAIASGKIPLQAVRICRVSGGEWNGNLLQLALVCASDDKPLVVASLNANGKSFSSNIEIGGEQPDGQPAPVRFVYRHSGEWVGPNCPQ